MKDFGDLPFVIHLVCSLYIKTNVTVLRELCINIIAEASLKAVTNFRTKSHENKNLFSTAIIFSFTYDRGQQTNNGVHISSTNTERNQIYFPSSVRGRQNGLGTNSSNRL